MLKYISKCHLQNLSCIYFEANFFFYFINLCIFCAHLYSMKTLQNFNVIRALGSKFVQSEFSQARFKLRARKPHVNKSHKEYLTLLSFYIEYTSVEPALTHWGRVTHICVGTNTNIGSDNGLSPARCQAIIWTNAGILLIGPLGTNFSEILIAIETFSFKNKHLKMSSAKCQPFCLGLNVLNPAGSLRCVNYVLCFVKDIYVVWAFQVSFYECAQPMGDDVTM